LAASVPLSEFSLSDHIFEALKEAETKVNQLRDTVNRRFLPIKAVTERTGLSKATIYRAMNAGTFPRPVPVSAASVRWLSSEIDDWMDRRIAEREVSS
jgi:prophage regulatory protein